MKEEDDSKDEANEDSVQLITLTENQNEKSKAGRADRVAKQDLAINVTSIIRIRKFPSRKWLRCRAPHCFSGNPLIPLPRKNILNCPLLILLVAETRDIFSLVIPMES
jgi:hypothetical protein